MESVRFMYLVQARCPQSERACTYFKIMEVATNSLVWKMIFSSKWRLCQIDQQSYGCCLVRQEEEKLWRSKQFYSLKYKSCVIKCLDGIRAHFNSKRRISWTWHYFFFVVGGGRGWCYNNNWMISKILFFFFLKCIKWNGWTGACIVTTKKSHLPFPRSSQKLFEIIFWILPKLNSWSRLAFWNLVQLFF